MLPLHLTGFLQPTFDAAGENPPGYKLSGDSMQSGAQTFHGQVYLRVGTFDYNVEGNIVLGGISPYVTISEKCKDTCGGEYENEIGAIAYDKLHTSEPNCEIPLVVLTAATMAYSLVSSGAHPDEVQAQWRDVFSED